ncbi:hypothetical protein R5H30_03195 [Sulfitobacter sp. D35]|uniref:hypothetical protein n=1 Tax=Sulfitobacter sp. D35 TaxID=3083252 RepID=UPI00296E9B9E|nr:hypothetical protein [Sulfitobacter sp. D35]MDW4496975.1 hypothetical protein [Sulfitobacter sp. D35]
MKPSFALSLSFDGIRLLHRAAGGWRVVGEVDPEAADLAGELAALRRSAAAIEPGGVRCKLLIPNEQIRYLTIPSLGMDADARTEAARRALDGATPYDVEDLVFDTCPDCDSMHVAAVARETLDEAEAFAETHRFNPVSFVAVPGAEAFLGEPWFGRARAADRVLGPDEAVEPDGVAVVIVGEVEIPSGPVVAEETGAPVVETEESREPGAMSDETSPDMPPIAVGEAASEATADVPKDDPALPEGGRAGDKKVLAEAPKAELPEPDDGPEDVLPMPVPPLKPSRAEFIEAADQGFAEAPAPPPTAPAPSRTTPSAPKPEPVTGFSSRRTAPPVSQDQGIAPAASGREPAVQAPKVQGAGERRVPTLSAPGARVNGARLDIADAEAEPAGKPGFFSRRKPARVEPAPARKVQPVPAPERRPIATSPAAAPKLAPTPPEAQRPPEAQPKNDPFALPVERPRGKPRYLGLILTVILLLVLLAVAAWASVRLDGSIARIFDRPEAAPESETETGIAAIADLPAPKFLDELPENAGMVTASVETTLSEEDAAVLRALRRPTPGIETGDPETVTPETAETADVGQDGAADAVVEVEADRIEADYAVTGIWPVSPQLPQAGAEIAIDDLYVTSIDPVSLVEDAVALPDAMRQDTDAAMVPQNSPVAPGTTFDLDERGLVVATAQGVVNPEGITVYLGRPALVPPAEMARRDPEVVEDPLQAALAEARPRLRPGNLIENNERANNDGLTRSELGALRPQVRPRSEQETALAAASLVPQDGGPVAAPAAADPFATGTRLAAAQSARPDARPGNFGRIIAHAQATAAAQAARVTTQRQAAAAAPVVQRTAAPNIPSSATVSRSATVKNAINLRGINLIGVYGKPSSRRALIRLSNGRYQKVKVGDRLDGGRVSAIGDSELRYQKGGRNVVLRMPRT